MAKSKKTPVKLQEPRKTISLKDMNLLAREEFVQLIKADTFLNPTWKNTITSLISEKIPDDLSPLQVLIDGVPNAETETTQG